MKPFEVSLQNTDEKGGKKPEKKKTILDEDDYEEVHSKYHSSHTHRTHGGYGGGHGGVHFVQCGNQ